MKNLEAVLFFLMILFSTPLAAGEIVEYSDIVNPENRFSIDFERSRVLVGDVVERASFCAEDKDYYCFESKALNFHVPKNLNDSPQRWVSKNGLEYEIEASSRDNSLFGTKIYRIVERDKDAKTVYLYSSQMGLMGFIFVYENEASKTFMLTGRCGFGAPDKC